MKVKRTYTHPAGETERGAKAARRRAALAAHGCATYTIGVRDGQPGIVCLCCGLGSSNRNDINQRYCGFCRAHHSEWKEDINGKTDPA